jgi:hypothetical protein
MLDSSLQFSPNFLSDIESWHGHVFFARDLIEWTRPKRIVELGVHKGDSLFTFAQSCAEAGHSASIVGIDHWRGDEHAGPIGKATYDLVDRTSKECFDDLVELRKCNFSEALNDFADESVDLLHLDGLHSYESVSKDFEDWFPKLKKDGIMLLHDISSEDPNFEVGKFWNELKGRFRNTYFEHSQGLAVLFGASFRSRNRYSRMLLNPNSMSVYRTYYGLLSARLRLIGMAANSEFPFERQLFDSEANVVHDAAQRLARILQLPKSLHPFFAGK